MILQSVPEGSPPGHCTHAMRISYALPILTRAFPNHSNRMYIMHILCVQTSYSAASTGLRCSVFPSTPLFRNKPVHKLGLGTGPAKAFPSGLTGEISDRMGDGGRIDPVHVLSKPFSIPGNILYIKGKGTANVQIRNADIVLIVPVFAEEHCACPGTAFHLHFG